MADKSESRVDTRLPVGYDGRPVFRTAHRPATPAHVSMRARLPTKRQNRETTRVIDLARSRGRSDGGNDRHPAGWPILCLCAVRLHTACLLVVCLLAHLTLPPASAGQEPGNLDLYDRDEAPAAADHPDDPFDSPCASGWVMATASAAIISGDERLTATQVAYLRAQELAKTKAIEQACGVTVQSERWYERFRDGRIKIQDINVQVQGYVLADTVLERRLREMPSAPDQPPVAAVEVTLCARCVCDDPEARDDFFQLEVACDAEQRHDIMAFRHGEKMSFRVTPTRDSYLTILNSYVDDRGEVVLNVLYPNAEFREQELVPAGQTFVFPPEEQRQDLPLTAFVLEGRDFSEELITVIATKEPCQFFPVPERSVVTGPYNTLELTRGNFEELVARLVTIRPQNRVVADMPIRIEAR